jgi:hypothetical protein
MFDLQKFGCPTTNYVEILHLITTFNHLETNYNLLHDKFLLIILKHFQSKTGHVFAFIEMKIISKSSDHYSLEDYLIFVTLIGVLVEDAHPGHDLGTEGTSSHLLIVVRMVFVISKNFHRWEIIVTTFAIEP